MTTATQYIWTTTTEVPVPVQFVSDDLTLDIYNQLLELYTLDLEAELMVEKLKKVCPPQDLPVPYPWDRLRTWPNTTPNPWGPDIIYGPNTNPYKVTSLAGSNNKYSEEYDTYFDPTQNMWLEDKCTDPNCEYCVKRPERPLP